MAIDCKTYSPKSVLQLLKGNPTFNRYVREGRNWDDVLAFVKVQLTITQEQEVEIEKYFNLKNK
tara:strand:- start:734 stop:925 length:192 start_codon:yes stop_codon:yes gene_type:complete